MTAVDRRRAGLTASVGARLTASVGAGLLVAFSLPPWGWWPLAFVGCALYIGANAGSLSFWHGLAFGAGWMYLGMLWMYQLTLPGYLVAGAVFAAAHGVAARLAPIGRWRFVGLPLAHSLVEAIRFSFPFGGVPLASLGISQAAGPVAGVARVGGVIALTWLVLQLAAGIAALAGRWGAGEPVAPATYGAVAVAAVLVGVSAVAPDGSGTGERLQIAAVQGGGEQGTRAIDVPSRLVTQAHLDATEMIAPDAGALDLVLWPENVIDTEDFASSTQLGAVAAQARRLGVPFVVGVTEDVPGRPGRITNAQVVVTPDGDVTSRYDKVRRVPFGEYVPLRGVLETIGAPVDQVPSNAIAGTDPAVIELPDGSRFAVVISWEVFFGGRARDGVVHGGGVILNPTNGASYTGTIVQTQQVTSSRLRAIETGRWVVQVAPTGFTAVISPGGEVVERTAVGERRVVMADVEVRTGRTWYVRLGERPWIIAIAAGLLAAHLAARSPLRPVRRNRPDRADFF